MENLCKLVYATGNRLTGLRFSQFTQVVFVRSVHLQKYTDTMHKNDITLMCNSVLICVITLHYLTITNTQGSFIVIEMELVSSESVFDI